MLQIRASVDLGTMTIKGYSEFPKPPALLEPNHQFRVITGQSLVGVLLFCKDAVGAFCSSSRLGQEKRMRNDLREIFKIINGIPEYDRHFFSIFLPELGIYCQGRFQKLSQQTIFFCIFANSRVFFGTKLPHQFKNCNSSKDFRLN